MLFDIVSIHAPARGATIYRRNVGSSCCVSIHAPARGATYNQLASPSTVECFNPRSRTGSDSCQGLQYLVEFRFNPRSRTGSDFLQPSPGHGRSEVSIHAPARGATPGTMRHGLGWTFQSTLPHGERPVQMALETYTACFNPRSRTGSDQEAAHFIFQFKVSIHAPARGATFAAMDPEHLKIVSIHAPARGATPGIRSSS